MKNGQNNTEKPVTVTEAVKAFNWKLAATLVLSCAVFIGLYFYLISFSFWKIVVISYVAVASLLILAYFIINRAFTGNGVTYEMLPDIMTHDEKNEYLADVADRERRSRPLLIVIFPIIITLLIDLFRLFVIDGLIGG